MVFKPLFRSRGACGSCGVLFLSKRTWCSYYPILYIWPAIVWLSFALCLVWLLTLGMLCKLPMLWLVLYLKVNILENVYWCFKHLPFGYWKTKLCLTLVNWKVVCVPLGSKPKCSFFILWNIIRLLQNICLFNAL